MTLSSLILSSNTLTINDACDLLGIADSHDLGDAIAEAAPHQIIALEMLAGLDNSVSAIEMLDLADEALGRKSRGRVESRRIATWQVITMTCPLQRGAPVASHSMHLPSLAESTPANRRTLNREIRALTRILWGAAWIRDAGLAITTARQYALADLTAAGLAEILRCASDDLRLARRARQLAAHLAAYSALGTAHAGEALAAELGITRGA
jgi:hypothetical protein